MSQNQANSRSSTRLRAIPTKSISYREEDSDDEEVDFSPKMSAISRLDNKRDIKEAGESCVRFSPRCRSMADFNDENIVDDSAIKETKKEKKDEKEKSKATIVGGVGGAMDRFIRKPSITAPVNSSTHRKENYNNSKPRETKNRTNSTKDSFPRSSRGQRITRVSSSKLNYAEANSDDEFAVQNFMLPSDSDDGNKKSRKRNATQKDGGDKADAKSSHITFRAKNPNDKEIDTDATSQSVTNSSDNSDLGSYSGSDSRSESDVDDDNNDSESDEEFKIQHVLGRRLVQLIETADMMISH